VRLGFVTFAPTRVLDGVKSLSYAANMLSSRLAKQRGFDEALLVTPHGRVLEAPTSSLFWADADGRLFTPPLDDHILASITRGRLLRLVDVEERATSTDDLLGAAEAFLASTTREVHPVAAIEGREFASVGPRTGEATEAFRVHVRDALAGPA
jgi:branched-chain amino acid aminotransferase